MQTQSLYTHRPLVYRRRDSMAEFFEESPLWESLYRRLYLPLKKKWNVKATAKDVFNEAYGLIVQTLADARLEENFTRYKCGILRQGESACLCEALVYALTLRIIPTKQTGRAIDRLLRFAKDELGYFFYDVEEILQTIPGRNDIDFTPCPADADQSPSAANARLAEENKQLTAANARLEDENETRRMNAKRLKTIKAALEGENARLKDENARLAARVAELEQLLAERDTVQRLPLSDFLTHVEQLFTHEQNPSALIVKDVLFALYTNPTAEERCRLNKLGHVPPPPPFGGITVQGPLNDIHGNEHVKAGL